MKTMLKRSMAILLVLLMAISVIPITAAAADPTTPVVVAVTEVNGAFSKLVPSSATLQLASTDLTLTGGATESTVNIGKIISKITVGGADQSSEGTPKYKVFLAGGADADTVKISNIPGQTTALNLTLGIYEGSSYIVDAARDFTITVSTDLKYVDYKVTFKVLESQGTSTSSVKTTGEFLSTANDACEVSYVVDSSKTYTWSASIALQGSGPAGIKLKVVTGAISAETGTVGIEATFADGSAVSGNYIMRNPKFNVALTKLPAVGITIGKNTVYDNSKVPNSDWVATGSYGVPGTTFATSVTIPSSNSTVAASGVWTITKAEADSTDAFGKCVISGSGTAQTITYYPVLDAAKTTQKIKFTLAKSDEPATTKEFVLTLTFAAKAITPTYAEKLTQSATNVTVNSQATFSVAPTSIVTGFNNMADTQKGQFTYSIKIDKATNGSFYVGSGLSETLLTDCTDQLLNSIANTTVTYKTKAAVVDSATDKVTVTIKNNDATVKTYTVEFQAIAGITPTYNTSISTTAVVDSYKTVYLSGAIKNYSSLTTDQKGKFTYTISGFDVDHGYLYVGNGTTSAYRVSNSTTGSITSATYFTYRPTSATSSSNYDDLTLNVYYDGAFAKSVPMYFYATKTSADCYTKTQFNNSYGSSSYGKYAFGVVATNSTSGSHSFKTSDFKNDSVDIYDDDYNDYLYITQIPIGGTLYYDGSRVREGDYIDIRYLSDLEYERDAKTDTGIDCFTFKVVTSTSKTTGSSTYTMWIVGDSTLLDGSDSDGYTKAQFNASYGGSSAFGVYCGSNKSISFVDDDFDNGKTDIAYDYEDYYIEIVTAPVLGTLYEGNSKLRSGDRVAVDDLSDLDYDRDTTGIDKFTFKVYKTSSGTTTATSTTFTMWVVNDNSLLDGTSTTTKATLTALDFTVSTYEKEEIDLTKADFVEAFGLGKSVSLSKVYITALPTDGDLYYGSSSNKVAKGDSFSASNLSDIYYVPDGSTKDYTDTFTWYGESTNGDYSNSAYGSIYVFADRDDYDDVCVSGSFSAYMDDEGEIEFDADYFNCAYDAAGTGDKLTSIYITSLPSSGTLFDVNHEITSSDVKNGYEMDIDDLYYEGSVSKTATFKYMANDDDTDYATEGTVSIQKPLDTSTSSSSGAWSATGTTSPVYTVSKAAVSSGVASVTLGSSFVTEALKNCKSGSNLTIVISPASTANGLTMSLDGSLFTTANALKIPYITLSEGTNGASVQISVADYISAAGTGKTLTLELDKLSVTVANSMVASTATAARSVTVKAGTASVSFPSVNGMVLAIPYSNTSSYSDEMVVMYDYTGSNTPIVSSEYVGNMVYASIATSGKYLVAVNNVSFTDTASNWAWTRGYIANLAARGTINGYTDNTYKPDASVTRAEFVKLLIVSLGLEDSSANCTFADMSGHWAYKYVAAAYELGVVDAAGEFKPDVAITRQDMALFAYRAAKSAGLTLSSSSSSKTFTDESQITGEYYTAVKAMQSAGIINGMAGTYEGYYKPLDSTKRADASKIIWFLNALLYDWSTSGKY